MERFSHLLLISLSLFLLNSCAAIEGIFKAGMWTGFLIVGLVIAVVIWIIVKVVGGGKR